MKYKIVEIEETFEGSIQEKMGKDNYMLRINDKDHNIRILLADVYGIEFIMDGAYHKTRYEKTSTNQIDVLVDGVPITINRHTELDDIVYKNSGGAATASEGNAQSVLQSPIPGKVVSTAVKVEDTVKKGDVVCVLESMKMQVSIRAHKDGTIISITVKDGDTVAKGDLIAEIE